MDEQHFDRAHCETNGLDVCKKRGLVNENRRENMVSTPFPFGPGFSVDPCSSFLFIRSVRVIGYARNRLVFQNLARDSRFSHPVSRGWPSNRGSVSPFDAIRLYPRSDINRKDRFSEQPMLLGFRVVAVARN